MASSSPSARRTRAVESFQTAAECIGPVTPGLAVFAVTRGQFSMIDAILHVLDQVGPAAVSCWTWTIASYEIESFRTLHQDRRVTSGRLVIDEGARAKNLELIVDWRDQFGADSVRYVHNHAKIATVEGGGFRVLLRGSMNLNANPRFEQLDVTEGGPDFDLVRRIEDALPVLGDLTTSNEAAVASQILRTPRSADVPAFAHLKPWRPK